MERKRKIKYREMSRKEGKRNNSSQKIKKKYCSLRNNSKENKNKNRKNRRESKHFIKAKNDLMS